MRLFLVFFVFATVALHALAKEDLLAARATLMDNEGREAGTASFTQGENGLLVHIEAHGLTPGRHGFHIHSAGDCSDHDHFKKAGGHAMNEGETHGILSARPHAGDFPNLFAGKDGVATADFFNERLSLADMKRGLPLLDQDGSALMIHQDADDYVTDPTGNSGDRVACGVIGGD